MNDEIELYKQILQAKKSHQNYISSIGPFGEQKISTREINDELSDDYVADILDKRIANEESRSLDSLKH